MGIGQEDTPAAAEAAAGRASVAGTDAEERGSAGSGTSKHREEDRSDAGRLDKAEGEITPQESLAVTLLRNIRYHEDRQDFFTLVNRVFNFAVLMSGTAVVTTLAHADKPGFTATLIAAGTTAIGSIQLIWDPGQKQFLHESLRASFLDLLADLSSNNVVDIRTRAAKLYSSEPPTYYAVDALAFNAAQKAQDRPDGTRKAVSFWQKRTRNLIRFTSTKFVSLGDIPPRRWRWHWPLERG